MGPVKEVRANYPDTEAETKEKLEEGVNELEHQSMEYKKSLPQ